MIEVNGIQLQIESEPRLLFMANSHEYKGRATKTFSIIIANTPLNNEALDNLFSKRHFRQVRFTATMQVEDFTMIGSLLIDELNETSAEGIFVTSNALLWETMEDKNIRSYNWDEFDTYLNDSYVMASDSGADIVFELTDRGLFDYDSGTAAKVDITERYPAVKIAKILETIFKQEGVYLSWHGEPSVLDKLQNKYYLQYTQDKDFRNSNEWMDKAFFYAQYMTPQHWKVDQITDTVKWSVGLEMNTYVSSQNPGGYWSNANHEFTAKEKGTYRFIMNIRAMLTLRDTSNNTPLSASGLTYKIRMYRNEQKFLEHTFETNLGAGFTYYIQENEDEGAPLIIDSKFIELQQNTVIRFEIYLEFSYTFFDVPFPFSGETNFELTFNTLITTNQMSRYYGAGSVVKLSEILPDMSTLKFLGSLFKTLGVNVYYNHLTNEAELHAMSLEGAVAEIDVYDVEERIEEAQNIRLKFNTDKVQQPGDEVIRFGGAKDDKEIKFDFSRTLFYSCYRLFNEINSQISVLWDSENPLHHPRFINYVIPAHKTSGNLRIIEYEKRKTGVRYYQTYGYAMSINEALRTSMPVFKEIDYVEHQRWQYSEDPVTIIAKAKLNHKHVWGFYIQDYFKCQVILKTENGEAMQGWVEEVEQLDGNIYQITMMRI